MTLEKPRRKQDKRLLESFKYKPCWVCHKIPSDPDHIRSRGAGGGDEDDNLAALCRAHHTQRHKIGWHMMAELHPNVAFQLKIKGWYFEHGKIKKNHG